VDEDNRVPVARAISLIDLTYGRKHLRLQILIGGELGSRRRCHDQQDTDADR